MLSLANLQGAILQDVMKYLLAAGSLSLLLWLLRMLWVEAMASDIGLPLQRFVEDLELKHGSRQADLGDPVIERLVLRVREQARRFQAHNLRPAHRPVRRSRSRARAARGRLQRTWA